MQSEQIAELAAALSKAQGAMQNAVMNRINPHFRSHYADLASTFDAARKPLSDNGLAFTQQTEFNNGTGGLRSILMHTSGQWISTYWPLPATGRPQEMGSALTYARRYSFQTLIGISAEEDDDGNLASKSNGKPETSSPVSIEQLGHIQQALVKNGIDIAWLIEFANKRNIPIARLEEIPASMFEKFLTAIKSKAAQNERPIETDPKHS
jgi:hypothetical protein